MMEILEKLFGSAARVKILRLFLFNINEAFDKAQVQTRSKVTTSQARSELSMMEKIGIIKRRSFFKDVIRTRAGKKKSERMRTNGWILNSEFEYLEPLQHLLITISPLKGNDVLKKLTRVGKLKLVITSGIFIQNWDSRVDLLVVGDNLRKNTLENIVKTIESEIGREIRYTAFETADFKYRLGVYDKLIRDILDFPHEIILDKISVTTK
jgi:hypothetical protein